jgi:hypothetical protein
MRHQNWQQTMENRTNSRGQASLNRLLTPFTEIFGLSRVAALASFVLIMGVVGFAVFWFFYSAPPTSLTITAGPAGSTFSTNAIQYRDFLKSNYNVTLKILPSEGSQQNLDRLNDPKFHVDVGFVQGGVTNGPATSKLVSLGSISYQPLLVFYRNAEPLPLLSGLRGKRLAIGPEGSGTRALALTLLALNGMETNSTTQLLNLDAADAAKALLNGSADAVFLMGDSASTQIMRELLLAPGIQLMDFTQADGYTRRINYLNKLELPMGSIDFGKNLPAHDLYLVGPTVEILARPSLHPALSDLLLEAARKVNGKPGLLRRKDEFPAPLEHDFPISAEALRFYKSGRTFLYSSLPFWLASLVHGVLVAFVPMLVVLVPGLRAIPALYKWRIRMLIYRRYRALLSLEREIPEHMSDKKRAELMTRLDAIAATVSQMKVPASFADQFYSLRSHIDFVRDRLTSSVTPRADVASTLPN